MASDRSPEPPIKLVFLRSEFARSNGGFGFRSIRPTATTSRGRDHLAASMHDTRGIDALRCMRLVLRHLHLSPAYTTVCVGINGSRSHLLQSFQSRKLKSRSGAALWPHARPHAGELDSIEKMSLQFGIAAPVLCSTASFLLVGIAMAQPAFR